jgi:hypothetical protein
MLDHLKIAEKFGISKKINDLKHRNTDNSQDDTVEIPVENLLSLTKNIGVRERQIV